MSLPAPVLTVQLGASGNSNDCGPDTWDGAETLFSHWADHPEEVAGSVLLVQVFGATTVAASALGWLDLFGSLGGCGMVVEAQLHGAPEPYDLPVPVWHLPSTGPPGVVGVAADQVWSVGEQISFNGQLYETGDLVDPARLGDAVQPFAPLAVASRG